MTELITFPESMSLRRKSEGPRRVVLKLEHLLESLGELVKHRLMGSASLLIQYICHGARQFAFPESS